MSRTANKPAQKGSMPQKRLGRTLSDHEVYELQRREHEARQQKLTEQKFCEQCSKRVYCSLRFEKALRSQCPIMNVMKELEPEQLEPKRKPKYTNRKNWRHLL